MDAKPRAIDAEVTFESFFEQAPRMNPNPEAPTVDDRLAVYDGAAG